MIKYVSGERRLFGREEGKQRGERKQIAEGSNIELVFSKKSRMQSICVVWKLLLLKVRMRLQETR